MSPSTAPYTPQAPDLAELAGQLIGDEAITTSSSSFTRRDLL